MTNERADMAPEAGSVIVMVIDPTAVRECFGSDVDVVVDDDVVDDVVVGEPWFLDSTTTVRATSMRTVAITRRRRRLLFRRPCLADDICKSVAVRCKCAFG